MTTMTTTIVPPSTKAIRTTKTTTRPTRPFDLSRYRAPAPCVCIPAKTRGRVYFSHLDRGSSGRMDKPIGTGGAPQPGFSPRKLRFVAAGPPRIYTEICGPPLSLLSFDAGRLMHRFANKPVTSSLLAIGVVLWFRCPVHWRRRLPAAACARRADDDPAQLRARRHRQHARHDGNSREPALQWKPEFMAATDTLFGMADNVKFRRDIFCLEFSFKPLRMIEVDVPVAWAAPSGNSSGTWCTAVRNTGQVLKPVEGEDGVFRRNRQGRPGPIPAAVRSRIARSPGGRRPVSKSYLDRVIPAAVPRLASAKRPARRCSTVSKSPSSRSP